MIIKANTPALQALYAPEKTKEPEGIFKKLATGQIASLFKIDNSPVFNETMKVKIRELDLNARYAQEAVSIAQTAQEGLYKIQGNLDRMKELVTMASQDIYSDEDRQKIQAEINSLNGNIDKIANDTNYKGHNILATVDSENDEAQNDVVRIQELIEEAVYLASQGNDADEIRKQAIRQELNELYAAASHGDHYDAVEEILKEFGRSSFTAEALGTDKVDVSSAEAAAESLKIVDSAIERVNNEIDKWKRFEMKYARYFELNAPEDSSSLVNKPTMVIDALELIKYNLLNTDAHILLDNSCQNPDRVTNLLK